MKQLSRKNNFLKLIFLFSNIEYNSLRNCEKIFGISNLFFSLMIEINNFKEKQIEDIF